MKKWLVRTLLRLAIAVAIWCLKDQTKAQINKTVTEKITAIYRLMLQRMRDQEDKQQDDPDAQQDNAPRRPIRDMLIRILGLDYRGNGKEDK